MAKGARSRSTKRPTPVVKRAAATSAPPKASASAVVTAAPKRSSAAPLAVAPATPIALPTEPAPTPAVATTRPATTVPALSTAEQWVSAFTRGFPFVLTEYCLFLLAVFAGPVVAILVGVILVLLIVGNRAMHGRVIALLPANVLREAEALLGQRDDVFISLGIIGVGLLSWALWNGTGIMLFSWLSLLALFVALFLLFYAQRIQTPRETGTP